MRISKWIEKNTASLAGKTVAISGSTGGLGRELCRYLTSLGAALILLDRNPEKSASLERELKAEFPDASVSRIRVDMADMPSVVAAADELCRREIDFLLLNAGAYSIPRYICETGYDNVFQINFVSPYYLARRLLPAIRTREGRVIAVGSIAHNYSRTDSSDVDFSTRRKASLVYGNSKRYLTYALPALAEREGEIAIAHPGITFTGITAHYPKLIFALIKHPMKIIFMSPRRAALSILAGLFDDCRRDEWIGPSFFDVWGLPRKKKLRTASAEEIEYIRDTADRIYGKLN